MVLPALFGGLDIASTRATFTAGLLNALIIIGTRPRILNFMFRVALAFEPLAPTAINLFMSRSLNRWKEEKIITDYKVHTKRIHRIHYRVNLDLVLTAIEVHYIINHRLPQQLEVIRRWFNG